MGMLLRRDGSAARTLSPGVVLCVLALVLAACGGDPEPTAEPTTARPPAVETERSATAATAPGRAVPDGEARVAFLDVGQGDATLIQAPDATVLIDSGRHDRSDVVPALRARDVEEIDVVAITHGHADHVGQLPDVLDAFRVEEVWMSGTPHTTLTFDRATEAIERSEASYEEPRAGDTTTVGSLRVDVVHPARLTGDLHGDTLGMRVAFGQVSFLFTGDAEAPHEAEMAGRDPAVLDSTVYQAGHHGSRTSTTAAFLGVVGPEVAVYSAGEGNEYGHPHREVISRLRGAGVEVYGTATQGTVTVTTDGTGYEVSTEREGSPGAGAGGRSQDRAPQGRERSSGREEAGAGGCVDINSAGREDLQRIVHIGTERADQLVRLRPFSSVDALTRIRGIGDARIAEIEEQGLACVR